MKKLIFVVLLTIFSFSLFANGRFVLVIDAGHGGKDSGAVGLKKQEKNIALNVAKLFGQKIKDTYPDVDVYYTRDGDSFLELWQRTALANSKKAQLFISIHCNSSAYNPALSQQQYQMPSGFETFVMGVQKSERSLQIAMKENSVILQEDNYVEMYDGFNPNDPEAYIMMANMQDGLYGSLNQSIKFADFIQANMSKSVDYKDRKVQQAPFRVLYGLRCPSVLTEIGFINNPDEEAFMSSEEGSTKIANALFLAFAEYKKSLDITDSDNAQPATASTKSKKSVGTQTISNVVEITTRVTQCDTIVESVVRVGNNEDIDQPIPLYKIQFYTGTDPVSAISSLNSLGKVDNYFNRIADDFSYTVGSFENLYDAIDLLIKVQAKGFQDAFIVEKNSVSSTQSYIPVSVDKADIDKAKERAKVRTPKIETPKVETPKVETPKVETPKVEAPKYGNNKLIYKVQFYTGTTSGVALSKVKNVGEIGSYLNKKTNTTSYTVGEFESIEEATVVRRKVQELGFKDAFIVKFKDGVRVD
jgi:N-acetylmuramoyl-L-alanine amidase